MNTEMLSQSFRVRSLTVEDADSVLRLWEGNPLYFAHCPPAPSRDGVLEDMRALPPGKKMEDKYYLGFFDGEKLAAVIDLIDDGFFSGTRCETSCFPRSRFSSRPSVRFSADRCW